MPAPHRSVFLQAGCPSCHPTNSVKALNAAALKADIFETDRAFHSVDQFTNYLADSFFSLSGYHEPFSILPFPEFMKVLKLCIDIEINMTSTS